MGNFAGRGIGPARARLESIFHAGHIAHRHLRTFDRSDYAAKRRGGGFGRRLWWRWQSDGIRPARSGYISFQGHDVVRHHVYADVHGVDYASKHDRGVSRQLRVATILEDVKAAGARGSGSNATGVSAGPGRSCSGSAFAYAFEISWTVQNPAADPLPRIKIVVSPHPVRKWRNWQTHHLEGVAP